MCVSKVNETPDGWMGLDIAGESIAKFSEVIAASKTVLWNGPMGVFEMEKFSKGTSAIAQAVAKATQNGAFSLIGGGDSVAAINKNRLADKVSYVSTGGGAMLEYMEGKALPGITAIRGPAAALFFVVFFTYLCTFGVWNLFSPCIRRLYSGKEPFACCWPACWPLRAVMSRRP